MNFPESKFEETNGRRRPPIRRGLVIQLFTVVILPLSLLLILTAFAGLALHQQSMQELAAERNERTVRSIANTLGNLFQQRIEITQMLAQDAQTAASADELGWLLTDAVAFSGISDASLTFMDASGQQLASAGDPSFLQELDAAMIVNLLKEINSGKPISKIIPTPKDGTPILVVAASAPDRSVFAISAFSPAKEIERSLEGIFPPNAEYGILVITADQQVLYRISWGDLEHPQIDHPGVHQALDNQVGSTYMDVGNDEHIIAYSPVQPLGWALVIEEPWSTIASRMLRVTENAPLVLIPIVVLTVLALWFTSRYIVRPLKALETKAVELGWGDYQAIEEPVGGIDEIHNLQNELIHLAQKVSGAQKGLRDYIGAITVGQEEERRRLARELHDDTLQSLIALNQRLQLIQLAETDGSAKSQHKEGLDHLQSMADQTIQDLRRITRALRPIYLEDLGLVAALEMLAMEIETTQGLPVVFKRLGSEIRLTPEVELALYRIAQEALTNAIKHANAEAAEVIIHYKVDLVTLEISDNGLGFDIPDSPAAFAPGGHFGLLGMYERAEMIGAKLEIMSEYDEGSRIIVRLSLQPKEISNG